MVNSAQLPASAWPRGEAGKGEHPSVQQAGARLGARPLDAGLLRELPDDAPEPEQAGVVGHRLQPAGVHHALQGPT